MTSVPQDKRQKKAWNSACFGRTVENVGKFHTLWEGQIAVLARIAKIQIRRTTSAVWEYLLDFKDCCEVVWRTGRGRFETLWTYSRGFATKTLTLRKHFRHLRKLVHFRLIQTKLQTIFSCHHFCRYNVERLKLTFLFLVLQIPFQLPRCSGKF